jgi:hypothetical protein
MLCGGILNKTEEQYEGDISCKNVHYLSISDIKGKIRANILFNTKIVNDDNVHSWIYQHLALADQVYLRNAEEKVQDIS